MENKTAGPIIAIIAPCYNEEEILPETVKKLIAKLQQLINEKSVNEKSKIYFIDDGSKDSTWSLIKKYNEENTPYIGGIKLSRNSGTKRNPTLTM